MKRKGLCLLLSLCIAVTMMPALAFAESADSGHPTKKVISHEKKIPKKEAKKKKAVVSKRASDMSKKIKPLGKKKASSETAAVIGNTSYASLQEAIDAVQSGQTITMTADIMDESIMIDRNVTFTIDMNTHSLTMTDSSDSDVLVINAGNVTIKNGYVIHSGYFEDASGGIYTTGIFIDAKVNLQNMMVETLDDYSIGYYVGSGGNATITNSVFYDGSDPQITAYNADYIKGFYIEEGGTATLNSCSALLESRYGIVVYGNVVLNNSDFIGTGDEAIGAAVGYTGKAVINGGSYWGIVGLWMDDYGARATIKKGTFESSYFDTSAIEAYVDSKSYGTGVTIALGSSATPASWRTRTADKIVVDNKLIAPSISKVSIAGATSLKLYWNKVSGAKEYYIYRSTSKSGKYSRIKITKSTSYTNTGLKNNRTYYYKVLAVTSVSGGKNSSLSGYKSGKATLAKPVVKLKKSSKTKAKVSWKRIAGADGYYIYRATSKNGKYKRIKTITRSTTISYTNSKLKRKKSYYYKVKAYDKVSKKTYTSPYSSAKRIKM